MYAKSFFQHFWAADQRNELFVCMPFHTSFDIKFKNIFDPGARKAGFDKAVRVDETWEANVITDKLFDGIANSKMLLFDLSDDPKAPCQYSKQVNSNVLYELGVANAMREPEDIVLMRENSVVNIPFDVSGLNINVYKGDLTPDWLVDKLKRILERQGWYKSKRVQAAARSIDDIGLELMVNVGKRPSGYNHFNVRGQPIEIRMAASRLVDLGILWLATAESGHEHAYRWTPFGLEVVKFLGIRILTKEEFERSEEWKEVIRAQEEFRRRKEQSKLSG